MPSNAFKTALFLSAYAVAMAMVEAAATVYLRELYYPQGFFIRSAADLAVIPAHILTVELWREAATIVMLIAVGWLASPRRGMRIAAFLYAFSVWDLGYYLFLYLFLSWPPSLGTTDVYFLIPWPWLGPVWLPLALFAAVGGASLYYLLKK